MAGKRNQSKKTLIAKVERVVTRAVSKTVDYEKEFYANLSANIKDNLTNYLDGTAAHIQKAAEKRAKDNAKTANVPLLPCTSIFETEEYLSQTTFTCTKCSRVFHGRDSLYIHIEECAKTIVDSDKENVSPKLAKKGRKKSSKPEDCVLLTLRRGVKRKFKGGHDKSCKKAKTMKKKKAKKQCRRGKKARKV